MIICCHFEKELATAKHVIVSVRTWNNKYEPQFQTLFMHENLPVCFPVTEQGFVRHLTDHLFL